jgi:hypothetical protein
LACKALFAHLFISKDGYNYLVHLVRNKFVMLLQGGYWMLCIIYTASV